jgi:hypothetical protein
MILTLIFLFCSLVAQAHPHFFVIIPTFRNRDYCIQNIQALAEQHYQDWHALVLVDGAPEEDDGTACLLESWIKEHNLSEKIAIQRSTERRYALRNIYCAIHQYAQDDWVITLYDGDDFYSHIDFSVNRDALSRIAQEYQQQDTWMTYGQLVNYPWGTLGDPRPFPAEILATNGFRRYQWLFCHPRTFYAWLFKEIKLEDCLYEGSFFETAWDVAFMPMLEMATGRHIRFIDTVLYAYRHHARNDYATNFPRHRMMETYIRSKASYKPLHSKKSHACKMKQHIVSTANLRDILYGFLLNQYVKSIDISADWLGFTTIENNTSLEELIAACNEHNATSGCIITSAMKEQLGDSLVHLYKNIYYALCATVFSSSVTGDFSAVVLQNTRLAKILRNLKIPGQKKHRWGSGEVCIVMLDEDI